LGQSQTSDVGGGMMPRFTPVHTAIPKIVFGGSSVLRHSALSDSGPGGHRTAASPSNSAPKPPPPLLIPAAVPPLQTIASTSSLNLSSSHGGRTIGLEHQRDGVVSPREMGRATPPLGGTNETRQRKVRFDVPESLNRPTKRAMKHHHGAAEDGASGDEESEDDGSSANGSTTSSRQSSLIESQTGGGVLRRHLGLPLSISRPLEHQISNDADYTFRQICNALGVRTEADREMNKAVSVLRMTNESIQSTRNMKQQGVNSEHDVAGDEVDCHWFAARNIIVERVAGVSNDAFSLAACSLAGASETDLLQWQAFAGQARRGFPTGGFTPGEQHPLAIIFEPMVPFSEYEGVGHDTATRIKSNLRVLLVGTAHRASNSGQRRLVGHELASESTRRLLRQDNECAYHARIEAERQHRKAARARRDAERGINPFYVRTKPVGLAGISNSILQHSTDELMVSAGYWLGESALSTATPNGSDDGGGPASANITLDEANLQRLRADISRTTFGPTHSSSPSGGRVRSSKRVFPAALTQLLLEKQQAAMQPLREQKPVRGVRVLPNFVAHDELRCVPEFMIVYEEAEPALELGHLLVEVDELILKGPALRRPQSAPQSAASGNSKGKQSSSSDSVRRKQLDPTRATVLVRELRKAPPKALSVIEYTTRWGGPIEGVATRASRDVAVRKWFQFPSPSELEASSSGSIKNGGGVPLTQLLEVCRHGSVSIDVKNNDNEICFRHSFVFGSSTGLH
jgi:hypothetical protein